jgi:hypothetical protein
VVTLGAAGRCNVRGIVGGLIIAAATLALIWVGIEQLQGLTRTANADFILRRTDQFFRPETRTLLHLIEDGYLLFEEKRTYTLTPSDSLKATYRRSGIVAQATLSKIAFAELTLPKVTIAWTAERVPRHTASGRRQADPSRSRDRKAIRQRAPAKCNRTVRCRLLPRRSFSSMQQVS